MNSVVRKGNLANNVCHRWSRKLAIMQTSVGREKEDNEMNDPERGTFHSPGQRPEEKGNAEEMEAGESEGRTKVDLRVTWPQWFVLVAHTVPRLHLGLPASPVGYAGHVGIAPFQGSWSNE